MSHNVELKGVEFKDLSILEKAVKELISEGVIDAEFRSGGGVPIRGWRGSKGEGITYGNSAWDAEHNHTCEAGIVFNGGKYDIGFNKNADGSYVPFMENSWKSPLAADTGAKAVDGTDIRVTTAHGLPGQSGDGNMVGKLSQRYALLMAERNARNRGIMTRRSLQKGGVIQLVCLHK